MGYADLCAAVLKSAVKDYERMLVYCYNKNINDPKTYYADHYRKVCSEGSLTNIIMHGLSAKAFLKDPARLSIYTDVDGEVLIRAAQMHANAKCANRIVNKKKEE